MEPLRHTEELVVADSAYLFRWHPKGPRRKMSSNRRIWLGCSRVFGARAGQVRYLKAESHAADPDAQARCAAWAFHLNDIAGEVACEAAAQTAIPQEIVQRVLALGILVEQIRGRLEAVQMM
eukprot:9422809-Pyramimonas_sp.AAC.1